MDRLKVLRVYLALRAHYTNKNYDIFKYEGRISNCTYAVLEKNATRKMLVDRLSKRFKTPGEVMGYLLPQWLYSNGASMYNPSESEDNYTKWQKFKSNPDYYISNDISGLNLQEMIIGESPLILKEVVRGNTMIESAIAINKVTNFLDTSKDYFLFSSLCNIIVKSSNFIKFNPQIVQLEHHNEEV